MTPSDIDDALAAALVGRRLLEHPFYRRWEAGGVTMAELGAYAGQYRHFEAALPQFLASLGAALPAGPAKDLVTANLADELGDPVPHLELFDRFADALGATPQPPSPATADLLSTYAGLAAESVTSGLAGFLAYESQAAEVAATKADGLRRHYGLTDAALAFWDHHAAVDTSHDAWLRDALATTADDPVAVLTASRQAADSWWALLDEREAAGRSSQAA